MTKPKPKPKPKKIKHPKLYRCRMSCAIGKEASNGNGIPVAVSRDDWRWHLLFTAIDDLATHLEKP